MRRRRARLGRVGVWGLAMAAWDLWMRIPHQHRKQLFAQARKHGPRLAREALRARRRARAR